MRRRRPTDEVEDRIDRYRRVFDASFSALHAYVRRRAAASAADDIVAEVLTTAWRRLDDLPDGMELPWLYGVARRVLANHRRSEQRRLRLVGRLRQERAWQPTGAADALLDALDRLRPDEREVLRLAAWEHLTAAEIAQVMGCTPNAAALRLSRARKHLRDQLTDQDGSRTGGG